MSGTESQSAEPDFEVEIVRLDKDLFAAFRELGAARRTKDEAAEHEVNKRLIQIDREMKSHLEPEERKLKALLKLPPGADNEAKIAQLLRAFQHGAKLFRVWHDHIAEPKPADHVQKLTYSVLPLLESIGSDRLALKPLLDDEDVNVRAMAASILSEDLPERAIPIMEEISDTCRWMSAGWIAMFGLSRHRIVSGQAASETGEPT